MPRAVVAFVTDVVGPRGSVAHRIVYGGAAVALELRVEGIFLEQSEDEFFCFGGEMFFGDEGDGFVAFAPPRAGGLRGENHCKRKDEKSCDMDEAHEAEHLLF